MATAPSKKRTRRGKAEGGAVAQDADILMTSDGEVVPEVNPVDNVIEMPTDDGMISIQFGPPQAPKRDTLFEDNLAEDLAETSDGQMILGRISNQLLEGIEQDERDRSEWLQERSDGLDLLGLKVTKPGTGNVGSSATAVAGQSTVRDALLAEACDRFQANAFAELCPSGGPVKVMSYGTETGEDDKLAQDYEDDLNFYLTGSAPGTAKEYYPDTRKMLWWTGYASGMFKKVYRCPLRERPVSESVDGADLIVPSNATDLSNADRITQRIDMSHVVLKQMQLQGAYRDVDLTQPTPMPNVLTQKEGTVTGMNPNLTRPEDQTFTIYECYCNLDIEGFEHKRKGKETGLPIPYRVVLDKDSRTVLEIRRNWKPDADNPDAIPVAKIPFVLFPYATGLGFYGTGLLHRLGNYTMALTAMLRECIDAGMFASFPGFLYAKPAGRQLQNEFRVPPGGGAPIDVSTVGGDISRAVMPLPYKDVSTAMVALMAQTRETAARYGGTAEAPTGEGVVNAPVGSVLAAIDQATRIEGGVHKALYAAQREELQQLVELFREDPSALWRGNKRPSMGQDEAARVARFTQALDKYYLVPASDPNVPSHMHRLAKANTYLQTAIQTAPIGAPLNLKKVLIRWAAMVKIDGVEADLNPDPPPDNQPNPALIKLGIDKQNADTKQLQVQLTHTTNQAKIQSQEQIEAVKVAHQAHQANQPAQQSQPDPLQAQALALKAQQVQQSGTKMHVDALNAHAERENKKELKGMDIAARLATHPESQSEVNSELNVLSPLMHTPSGGMSYGGPVLPEETEEQRSIKLALAIAQALQERRNGTTVN